jgi:hypothetical protein
MLAESRSPIRDLTVACVLRSGGDYDAEYVERLQDGVRQHLSIAHRFVCLSDIDVPCERIPLRREWRGWWSKLELFEQLTGPTLYFDLDTVIVGSLDEIASYPHRFTMLSDFVRANTWASGVMAWSGDWSRLASGFSESQISRYQRMKRFGDGGWIQDHLFESPELFQNLFAGQIVSRKAPRRGNTNERVVCFHGLPRPRDVEWKV